MPKVELMTPDNRFVPKFNSLRFAKDESDGARGPCRELSANDNSSRTAILLKRSGGITPVNLFELSPSACSELSN